MTRWPSYGLGSALEVVRELAVLHTSAQNQQLAVGLGAEGVGPPGAGFVAEAVGHVMIRRAEPVLGATNNRRRAGRRRRIPVRSLHFLVPSSSAVHDRSLPPLSQEPCQPTGRLPISPPVNQKSSV